VTAMLPAASISLLLTVSAPTWQSLAPGVEYTAIVWQAKPSHGDGKLHVVRIDPAKAELVVAAASADDGKNLTAAAWRTKLGLLAVINAGMYDEDFSSHVGFFRAGTHTNSAKWVDDYLSVLVMQPRQGDAAQAQLIDLDADRKFPFDRYGVVVQNLRLLKAPGKNVWSKNRRAWSEAALAMDRSGRLLFLFSRTPATMYDFNNLLLAQSSLQIVRAMHLEGGPEASLSLHGAGVSHDLCGSFETGFNENDGNREQWPLPNILGVRARSGGNAQ